MAEKKLRVEYVGSADQLRKTLGEIDRAHQDLGQALVSRGKSLTTSLTLPFLGIAAVAANEFNEVERVTADTAAVIRSTGGAAGLTAEDFADLADRLGDVAAIDGEVVQGSLNVLATFTKIKNQGPDRIFAAAAEAALNLSTRMGTDLQSAMVLVGKALNDPIRGVTALTRAGVQLSEQQKAQIATMVEAGNAAGAQKIILAELETQFGGAAAAAGAAASPLTTLKLSFLDMAESIGAILMPFLRQAAELLAGVAERFRALPEPIQKVIVAVGAAAAAIGPLLIVAGKLVHAIGAISGAVKAMSAVLLANPYVAIAAATIAVAALIAANWGAIKRVTLGVFNAVKDFFVQWGPVILGILTGGLSLVVTAFVKHWDAIRDGVKEALRAVLLFFKALPANILEALKHLGRMMFDLGRHALQSMWEGLKSLASGVLGWVGDLAGDIASALNPLNWFSSPEEHYREVWGDAFRGIADEARRNRPAIEAAAGGIRATMAIEPPRAAQLLATPPAGPPQVTNNRTYTVNQYGPMLREAITLDDLLQLLRRMEILGA